MLLKLYQVQVIAGMLLTILVWGALRGEPVDA
jgi:hypothetical protein